MTIEHLEAFAETDIAADSPEFQKPFVRDARALADELGADGEVVLLGSIASAKYVDALVDALGGRLRFPSEFVGRGDMSRGGLLLRAAVEAKAELARCAGRGGEAAWCEAGEAGAEEAVAEADADGGARTAESGRRRADGGERRRRRRRRLPTARRRRLALRADRALERASARGARCAQ